MLLAPNAILDYLRLLDSSGTLTCLYDESVGRYAFARLPAPGVFEDLKILGHVSGPGSESWGLRGYWKKLMDDNDDVREKVESGEWTPCPHCAVVHGKFREPTERDVIQLYSEMPGLWPRGPLDFFAMWEARRILAQRENYKGRQEAWGPRIEKARWAMLQSLDEHSRCVTKEQLIEQQKTMERRAERRAMERGER